MTLRPLALTLGEPAGIGPEITAMAWRQLHALSGPPFFLIGDAAYVRARAHGAGLPIAIAAIDRAAEAPAVFPTALPVLDRPLPVKPEAGRLAAGTAQAVIASIDEAVKLAVDGEAAAVVTNPIQKETLYNAGFSHQGHTDYLGHLAGLHGLAAEPVMMLAAADLRTIPVTVHIALKDVPRQLTTTAIVTQARVAARDLQKYFRISEPRIGITGLNPHAGEGGAMGSEEQTVVAPAIAQLRAEGLNVAGPLPADTAFHAEARAAYDVIICMYHDQALIPVKTLDFHGGVNVTLGLPFIRTSPDHGTALALAGTGKANPRSLCSAIAMAGTMARHNGG